MRVMAALSGGVDSSVAAARLVDAGHDVVGVHLALARTPAGAARGRGCCTLDDARDARRVADMLGIPFYVWDLSEEFAEAVIADFLAEYERGRTPNPCVRCNERIKFAAVLDRATGLGFDAVATGHYARIVQGETGPELHRAADPDKDQSYVLAVMGRERLLRTVLPLGDARKEDVRTEAAERGLLVAAKPDSHDICFIPDGDTAAFLRGRLGERPGDLVDARSGAVVGRHRGGFAFTIGQRRGLGLTAPAEDGAPRYVVDIDAVTGTVSVGPREDLSVGRIEAGDLRWLPAGEPPPELRALVQVRAHGAAHAADVAVRGARVVARLDEPVEGLSAGQALVLYDGTRVLGAATVDATARR
jgi:tRNA-specific 2-thiouridylase